MSAPAVSALNPGVARREVFAWAMYDFANSGYTTVVLTAVFNAYFVATVAGNAPWATFAWTVSLGVSYAIVMVAGPVVGAWADAHAAKKRALAASTAACVAGTALLAFAGPGDVAWAVAFIVVSNVAYSLGENLNAAFLTELARPAALGRVSGWGWSLGYFGGILALVREPRLGDERAGARLEHRASRARHDAHHGGHLRARLARDFSPASRARGRLATALRATRTPSPVSRARRRRRPATATCSPSSPAELSTRREWRR